MTVSMLAVYKWTDQSHRLVAEDSAMVCIGLIALWLRIMSDRVADFATASSTAPAEALATLCSEETGQRHAPARLYGALPSPHPAVHPPVAHSLALAWLLELLL